MSRKPPILDPRSSVTSKAIDLKFGARDYVVGATQHAKNENNRPSKGPFQMGQISCSNVFFILCDFLRSSGEHILGSIATVFASNDVLRWGLIS